jgi:signal transduction histidine kinase
VSAEDLDAWRRGQAALAQLFGHDFRSPLSAITANLAYLEQGAVSDDEETVAVFSELRVSCDEFLRMVENQEVIGQLAASAAPSPADPLTDLIPCARAAVERVLPGAGISGVSLDFEAGAQAAMVRGPAPMLDLLVRNVASNGVTYARRNGRVRVRAELTADGAARLVMTDPGAAFGDPAAVFAREQQADLKHSRRGRYSRGLGPYLIGLVARRLGAAITADHDGAQSVLAITFPRG